MLIYANDMRIETRDNYSHIISESFAPGIRVKQHENNKFNNFNGFAGVFNKSIYGGE